MNIRQSADPCIAQAGATPLGAGQVGILAMCWRHGGSKLCVAGLTSKGAQK